MTNETRTKTHELGRRSWYDDPKSEATHEVHTTDSEDGILVRLVDRGTGRTTATIMWSEHSFKTVAWTEYREEDMVYECEDCGAKYNEEQLTPHCGDCGSEEVLHTSQRGEDNDE